MRLEFDWDPTKAASNLAKHGVTFDQAMAVFLDPLAVSIPDDDGADEERWITLGQAGPSRLLLVVHTYMEQNDDQVLIRLISVRRPTRREARQYREGGER